MCAVKAYGSLLYHRTTRSLVSYCSILKRWGLLNTQQQLHHETFHAFPSIFTEPMSQSKHDALSSRLCTNLVNVDVCDDEV